MLKFLHIAPLSHLLHEHLLPLKKKRVQTFFNEHLFSTLKTKQANKQKSQAELSRNSEFILKNLS